MGGKSQSKSPNRWTKKQTGPVLWTWTSIVVRNNNNNTSVPNCELETKFFWGFLTSLRVFKEGCTWEASRKIERHFVLGWLVILNLWESLQLPKGPCKEHICLQFNFFHLEASTLLVLFWCFGRKLVLNSLPLARISHTGHTHSPGVHFVNADILCIAVWMLMTVFIYSV